MNSSLTSLFFLVFLLSFLTSSSLGAFCKGKPSPNFPPNEKPIDTKDPNFVRQVKNGKLFKAGVDQEWYIAHLWGKSPYEFGLAQGQLLREEIIDFITSMWIHVEEQFEFGPDWVPERVKQYIAEVGLKTALELTYFATNPYTPSYWNEEIQGIVDGVNDPRLTFEDVLYLGLLGELSQASCSMFGAWGKAVEYVENSELLQLRALDWDTEGPLPKYPAVLVYHDPPNSHSFATVSWTGFIGGLTGMSSNRMAISEIGVQNFDSSWGEESRFGYPFFYMLRDILQFDNSVDDSINRMETTHRTCNILVGVGDGKEPEFKGFQSSNSVLNVFGDENLQPNYPWHPRIKDIVYWGMDWNCPGWDKPYHDVLTKFYGNITAENTIRYILPAIQTGDTHVAIYDLTGNFMYISIAGPLNTPNRSAYQRSFTKLDMTKLFNVTQPFIQWLVQGFP